jgi:hypothetical protein
MAIVNMFLKILPSLPVTTNTSDQLFSTSHNVKKNLRITMKEHQITVLIDKIRGLTV